MKNLKILVFILIMTQIFVMGCKNKIVKDTASEDIPQVDSFELEIKESFAFLDKWDLDGDGQVDNISFSYSGGAHCCYKLILQLTSDTTTLYYPFEMDGGYSFGVDDSQPDHFDIKDFDGDGLPEIFMEIYTYNGEKYPLEKEWVGKYGISTHYILFDFQDGKIKVSDYRLK